MPNTLDTALGRGAANVVVVPGTTSGNVAPDAVVGEGEPTVEWDDSDRFDLDELDRRIITELQDDGRKPSTEIARRLGVPRPTVARRIERLVGQKIITIGAFANGRRIGLPIHVMIQLTIEPGKHEAVVAAIVALDEVRWVGIATGPYDLLIEGMLRSNEHLQRFLSRRLGVIDGIKGMQTAHILDVPKITFDWERMLQAGDTVNTADDVRVSSGHGSGQLAAPMIGRGDQTEEEDV
ncbi:MAG TPA: Lrp/AsnC family transcriptional regulator [Thermomicrobiales bacterium]|jgi:Lrp/AsnC family transcriptional regulator for asnA, asnC and gidA